MFNFQSSLLGKFATKALSTAVISLLFAYALPGLAAEKTSQEDTDNKEIKEQIKQLQEQLKRLERKVVENNSTKAPSPNKSDGKIIDSGAMDRLAKLEKASQENQNWPIKIHGAVRFQYVYEDYNPANESRTGDLDFDIFRLNFDGEIGDVILKAEYRWFQYQEAVKSAYFGYNLNEQWQLQVGVLKIPFGNMPYNSHSYFFNSTFYVGLEDEHDAGIKMQYRSNDWDFDITFLKSDEQGGVDGYVSDRTARYNYDTVGIRLSGEGIYDEPSVPVGESNSWAFRSAHKWTFSENDNLEIGASLQTGNLYSGNIDGANPFASYANQNIGNRKAIAVHGVYNTGPFNFQFQLADYQYDVKIDNTGIVMAAYAFYDTIPSEAKIYTLNGAYTLPVSFGPLTSLTFYNDYSLITDKKDLQDDTWMNITGMAMAAGGGFYTYVDLVKARNQPFIGGTIASDGGKVNTRFNINFGYYF
ncbi:MAG: carbohydrate porin [Gammaproteobacteria bacterium]|nr:carbohydrate porin [Gammaproteobacteria bacterium]